MNSTAVVGIKSCDLQPAEAASSHCVNTRSSFAVFVPVTYELKEVQSLKQSP